MSAATLLPRLSILDLVPVSAGRSRAQALQEMLTLARTADSCGYYRYWLAEHHGSSAFISAATSVLMGQVLAATTRIQVGAGGIMLPNHAPLVVAEQISTLATLYPNRVALGLGRAPGTDRNTAIALGRRAADPESFARDIQEVLAYLAVDQDDNQAVPGSLLPVNCAPAGGRSGASARVQAMPGVKEPVPIWVLGSSVKGAQVAADLGLPFVVAAHLAPFQAEAALVNYRSSFNGAHPCSLDGTAHAAACVNVMVAPTQTEAQYLFTTTMAALARIFAGCPAPLDPPSEDLQQWRKLAPTQAHLVEQTLQCAYVGTAPVVVENLRLLAQRWQLEELYVATYAYDAAARRRSYELLAQEWQRAE